MDDPAKLNAAQTQAQKLYAERERRFSDVVALRQPDRVPISYTSGFWHARYAGISNRTAMYDYEALAAAAMRAIRDLQPDSVNPPFSSTALGPTLEMLGYKGYQWPGQSLPDDRPYQYLDKEYMRADEYDAFMEDPSWFVFTRILPRTTTAFEPLAKLPQLAARTSVRAPFFSRYFGDPEVAEAMVRIAAAGREALKMLERANAFQRELIELGFPIDRDAQCYAPYDFFGDFLRGSKGIMLDLFRHKDKLLEAMERLIPIMLRDVVTTAAGGPSKRVFIALHWGLDGFMSPEQFKTFYWPQLRKVLMALIDKGFVPLVFWEGRCDSRFETIADIPKGSCIYWFERSDLFRAKAVLGDVVCLRGNVPASMLIGGTPGEVRDYCRKLIEVVGKGGGFILDASSAIPQEARTENVFAMYQATREFGRYD
ncbi:MAG: uroporphyrinogen decarboxylase family protein [Pseudomonadota bacterium]